VSSTLVMHKVRPFWGRVLVMDSPVDEEELASGLIVPVQMEDSALTRAVVMHHDKHYLEHVEAGYPTTELIPVGTVIWYLHGQRVGDVVIVDADDIYAYEEDQ
jgi:co-chaperonin GroES (HSP10)